MCAWGATRLSRQAIKSVWDVYYPGAPHGPTATHQNQVNEERLQCFLHSSYWFALPVGGSATP